MRMRKNERIGIGKIMKMVKEIEMENKKDEVGGVGNIEV